MYYTDNFSRKRRLDILFFRKRVADIYPLTFRKKVRIGRWRVGNKELKIGEKLSFDEQFPLPITGEFEFPKVENDETVFLEVWAGGESLVKVDGKPYGEINEYHRLLRIDDLLDGKKHSITLEVVPKGLFGTSNFNPRFERSNLIIFNRKMLNAFLDFKLVFEVYSVVDDPLKSMIHDILLKAFGILEIPSDTLSYFKRVREDMSLERLLNIWNPPDFPEEFENEIDEKMVESFEKASKFLMSEMEKLSRKFHEPLEIFISGHAHIDYAWLWPIEETKRKIVRTFSNVIKLMESYSKFTFLQSSSAIYEDLKNDAPELYEKVKKKVKEGRWEIIGGSVVEFDANLISGESIVRQFLYGQHFFEEEFGKRCTVCYLPDTFGFTWTLPQLIKDAGMNYFITTKLDWNDKNKFPYRWFKWRGLDGSEVIANLFHGKYNYNSNLKPEDIIEHVNNWKERSPEVLYGILTFGYGDGGGGPTEEMLEYYNRYDKMPGMPKLIMTNISKKMEELDLGELPIWDDELYLELHRGTYTNQAVIKKMNRKMEHLMYLVEFFATIDYMNGGYYPEKKIDEAWSIILRSHFHDILPGTSIKEVYDDVMRRLVEAEAEMRNILDEKLRKYTENTDMVSILNPTSFELPVILKDVDIKEGKYGSLMVKKSKNGRVYAISSETKLLPLSVGYFKGSNPNADIEFKIDKSTIENTSLRVNIEGGNIKIFDKLRNREIVKNISLKLVRDIPPIFEAWEIAPESEKVEDLVPYSVEILDENEVTSSLLLKYEFQGSKVDLALRMYSGFRILDLEFDVDWHTKRNMLRLDIETDFLTRKVRNEIAFGYIERKTTKNTSFELARFEVPQHRWIEMGEDDHGLVIVNDSKYGFSALHSRISLSLLKGSLYPDFFSDEGKHHFEFRLIPHDGDWKTTALHHATLLNLEIPVVYGNVRDIMKPLRSLWDITENPVLSAVKKRKGLDDVILRFYEAFGKRTKLSFRREMYRSNILEDEIEIVDHEEIFTPFSVKTYIYKL